MTITRGTWSPKLAGNVEMLASQRYCGFGPGDVGHLTGCDADGHAAGCPVSILDKWVQGTEEVV